MSIRVLMADDHILVRQGIRSVLDQLDGIDVVGEAGNGRCAVELVRELNPDVVLMDIAMPEMNGIEATTEIKKLSPRTAVLVLSAYDDDAYVFALLEAGAAGYLLKNAPVEELADAIRSVHKGESVLSPGVARKVLARFTRSQSEGGLDAAPLSIREMEVLRIAASGLSNRAIAQELSLSPRTVQLHLEHIFEKMAVGSRTEAVVTALKRGWLRLEEIQ
jgi:DNA-binding NarL/FixJ family response regulator